MTLDFEKDKLVKELKKKKQKRVLVQLAEGIKQNSFEIAETIEKAVPGIEVVFSGETCWGGCGVAVQEAEYINADLIIHFGHSKFIDVDFPVIYIGVKDMLNLKPLMKKSLDKLKDFDKIGLSYSIQHKHDLEKIIKFYKDNGKKVVLSEKIGNVAYEGHVVGCQYEGLKAIQNKIDCFVIFGNQFHSMGAVLAVEKPVILIDVYNDDVRGMKGLRDKVIKQRAVSISKLRDAKKVGLITEIKPGQKFGSAKYLLKELEKAGKKSVLISMNEISPDKLMNFYDVDAFVELACPRIAVDDFAKYQKPILTFKEALIALNIMSWEEGLKKGFL